MHTVLRRSSARLSVGFRESDAHRRALRLGLKRGSEYPMAHRDFTGGDASREGRGDGFQFEFVQERRLCATRAGQRPAPYKTLSSREIGRLTAKVAT